MIERKKIQAFLVLVPTAMVLLACGLSGEEEEPEEEKVVIDYSNIPLDPYGCYLEGETWVQERKGVYLIRDEKYYSLNNESSLKDRPEYNVGKIYDRNHIGFNKKKDLEHQTFFESDLGPTYKDHIEFDPYVDFRYPLGDFECLTYNKDTDEIRSYAYNTLCLCKLEDVSYGFKVKGSCEAPTIETTDGFHTVDDDAKEFQYVLNDGTVVEKNYGFEKGTEITASWFEGTDYFEYSIVADRVMFIDEYNTYSPTYELEGELHKEGYATYDLSGVEAGIYRVGLTGNVEHNRDYLGGGGILIIE